MSRRFEIEYPMEDPNTGQEIIYSVSAYLVPYQAATWEGPAEGGYAEDIEIRTPGGYVVAEPELAAHGFTPDVMEQVEQALYDAKVAEADSGGCRCRGEDCRC